MIGRCHEVPGGVPSTRQQHELRLGLRCLRFHGGDGCVPCHKLRRIRLGVDARFQILRSGSIVQRDQQHATVQRAAAHRREPGIRL
jgi:hypothetical protein